VSSCAEWTHFESLVIAVRVSGDSPAGLPHRRR
jgi:hypothetical protein